MKKGISNIMRDKQPIPMIVISATIIIIGMIGFKMYYEERTVILYYKGLLVISLLFPTTKILISYSTFFVNFFFCVPNIWIKEIERPRLLFYILGGLAIYTSYIILPLEKEGSLFWMGIISSILFLIAGIFAMSITWCERFKKNIIPTVKEKLMMSDYIESCLSDSNEERLLEFIKYLQNDKINGSLKTLERFLTYNSNEKIVISENNKLEWIFQLGLKKNQKLNSQTLITLISNIYGTEESKKIRLIAEIFFKTEFGISHKNMSTWKKNRSEYLQLFDIDVSGVIKKVCNQV